MVGANAVRAARERDERGGAGSSKSTFSGRLFIDAGQDGLFGLDSCSCKQLYCPKPRSRRAYDGVKAMNKAGAPPVGKLSESASKHLAPAELVERLDSLSGGEKRKLRLIEQRRLAGTDFGPG